LNTDKLSINKSLQFKNLKKLFWFNTKEFKVKLSKFTEVRFSNKIELLKDEESSSKKTIFLKFIN
jgi:hypothetical protein